MSELHQSFVSNLSMSYYILLTQKDKAQKTLYCENWQPAVKVKHQFLSFHKLSKRSQIRHTQYFLSEQSYFEFRYLDWSPASPWLWDLFRVSTFTLELRATRFHKVKLMELSFFTSFQLLLLKDQCKRVCRNCAEMPWSLK